MAGAASEAAPSRADAAPGEVWPSSPILPRTRTVHRPVDPVAYDCVKVIFVRDGSAILLSEFGERTYHLGSMS